MHPKIDDLIQLLCLERIEDNIYRGDSRDIGSAQVFGGQVLAQALSAAYQTVENRIAHSLHAYFLRRGDMNVPIIYEVDQSRDGGSFSVRRVVAIQHGRPIFNLAASFHKTEEGFDHQDSMPDVEGPDGLKNVTQLLDSMKGVIPEKVQNFLTTAMPFEFRPVKPLDFLKPEKKSPKRQVWIRVAEKLPDNLSLHQSLLAYVSDFQLLVTCLRPHGIPFGYGVLQMATLDHALWFHRDCRLDDWILYSTDSPSTHGARGFARGQIFRKDGTLIASVSQEGLLRTPDTNRKKVSPSDPRLQI